MTSPRLAMLALLAAGCAKQAPPPPAAAPEAPVLPHIAFEHYTLDNGLQVILAPDDTTPIVHVNLWYHVGSKDEEQGLTGFAHLFEHLMFQGSVSHPHDYFKPLEAVGGRINGTTSFDRTNYFQTVPAEYLPLVLFLESDRMGWLIIDQEQLDGQREVVRNERRQRYDNRPYGEAIVDLFDALWPAGHPYAHMPIGSHEDLEAASLEVVQGFFDTWYHPNNAALVIAGDFDVEVARELVEANFGPIPRGPDPTHAQAERFGLDEDVVLRQYDDVPEQKVWLAWHSPPIFSPGDAELDLLADLLGSGSDSRLQQLLVRDRQIAKDVSVGQWSLELGGVFVMHATAAEGHTTDEVVAAIDEVIAEITTTAVPTAEEIEMATAAYEVGFYRRIEPLQARADLMNLYTYYTGDPGFIGQDLTRYLEADADGVLAHAREVFSGGRVELHIWPNDHRPETAEAPAETEETP